MLTWSSGQKLILNNDYNCKVNIINVMRNQERYFGLKSGGPNFISFPSQLLTYYNGAVYVQTWILKIPIES